MYHQHTVPREPITQNYTPEASTSHRRIPTISSLFSPQEYMDTGWSEITEVYLPVMEERFRCYFRFLDVNKDGVLTWEDHDALLKNGCLIYSTDDDTYNRLKENDFIWWTNLSSSSVDGQVSEDRYVQILMGMLTTDLDEFVEGYRKTFSAVFDAIDSNHDDKISAEEFHKYFKLFNVTDSETVERNFQLIDVTKKGFITREEWITANVNYATRQDPDFDYGFLYKFKW